jgi:hypothetical protein
MAVPLLDIAPDALLEKTQKGADEIRTRANKLGLRLRTVLIMVNGQIPMSELHARATVLGNAEAILSHLVSEGYVKVKVNVAEAGDDPLFKTQKLQTLKVDAAGELASGTGSEAGSAQSLDFSDFTAPPPAPAPAPAPASLLVSSGATSVASSQASTEAQELVARVAPSAAARAPLTPAAPQDLIIEFAPPPVPAPAFNKLPALPAGMSVSIASAPPAAELAAIATAFASADQSVVYDLTKTGSLTTLNVNAIPSLTAIEALGPVKFYIREQIARILGADAGAIMANVENAQSREELITELALFIQLMQDLTDPYEAESFRIGAMSLMPD